MNPILSAGFRTDKEYNANGEIDENRELEEWQPDPDYDEQDDEDRAKAQQAAGQPGARGWSVEEMFRANDKLGVRSSFQGIEQYCTAEPEGDEEARRRAEQIAREIEQSGDSARHTQLENDDEERDLDKETRFGSERDQQQQRPKRQSTGGGYGRNTGPQGRQHGNGGGGGGYERGYNNCELLFHIVTFSKMLGGNSFKNFKNTSWPISYGIDDEKSSTKFFPSSLALFAKCM